MVLLAPFSLQTFRFNNIVYIPLENYAVPTLFYGHGPLQGQKTSDVLREDRGWMPVDTPRSFYNVHYRFKLTVAQHFSVLFSV